MVQNLHSIEIIMVDYVHVRNGVNFDMISLE